MSPSNGFKLMAKTMWLFEFWFKLMARTMWSFEFWILSEFIINHKKTDWVPNISSSQNL